MSICGCLCNHTNFWGPLGPDSGTIFFKCTCSASVEPPQFAVPVERTQVHLLVGEREAPVVALGVEHQEVRGSLRRHAARRLLCSFKDKKLIGLLIIFFFNFFLYYIQFQLFQYNTFFCLKVLNKKNNVQILVFGVIN